MNYEDLQVGMKVKHRVSGNILTVEQIGGRGWFRSDQGRWVRNSDADPYKEYKIEEAFIVDKTLFRDRATAEAHLARIQIFEKLRPVFGGGLLTCEQSAIVDTLVDKLLAERQEFATILKGE